MASLGTAHLATIDVIAALPRCRDCRWWRPMTPDMQAFAGRKPAGLCQYPDSGMFMYGYVSDADIATVEDFGCVQFSAKEAPRDG